MVELDNTLIGDDVRPSCMPPEVAAAAAAAWKNGDGPPWLTEAKAAKLAADGPSSKPRLCMAAACKIGGLEAMRIFSISASCNRLDLALLFWNQILTWVSVKLRLAENSARSAMLKYCFSRNFFSSCCSCWVVNGVLGFLFGLCLRRVHRIGPNEGEGGGPKITSI